jgi:hypothetical protein
MNPVLIVDTGNGNDFAVDGLEARCPAIGSQ